MLPLRRPVLLLALAAPMLLAADPGIGIVEGQVTTMTFHERIIIRVPRLAGAKQVSVPQTVVWREHRGPKCIAANELAGVLVNQTDMIDLVLIGNRRLRARLDGACTPLDFYSGLYLKPAGDGKVCAARDAIRTRSGVSCRIETFRTLKPVVAKPEQPR